MLNNIRESFQHTRPSDDPVSEVMNRLPEHIVKGYLQNIKLKHAGVLLGLQQSTSGMDLIFTKRATKLKNHAGEIKSVGDSPKAFELDYEMIKDKSAWSNFENTCFHIKIFCEAFKNSKAYFYSKSLSVNLYGVREWKNI